MNKTLFLNLLWGFFGLCMVILQMYADYRFVPIAGILVMIPFIFGQILELYFKAWRLE